MELVLIRRDPRTGAPAVPFTQALQYLAPLPPGGHVLVRFVLAEPEPLREEEFR